MLKLKMKVKRKGPNLYSRIRSQIIYSTLHIHQGFKDVIEVKAENVLLEFMKDMGKQHSMKCEYV